MNKQDQLPMVIDFEGKKTRSGKAKVRQIGFSNPKKTTHDFILGIAAIYDKRTAEVLDDLVDFAKKQDGLDAIFGKKAGTQA